MPLSLAVRSRIAKLVARAAGTRPAAPLRTSELRAPVSSAVLTPFPFLPSALQRELPAKLIRPLQNYYLAGDLLE